MHKRSQWLLSGGIAALLAFVLVGSAAASLFFLGLDSSDPEWQLGGEANLDVMVDPALVGGHGDLMRKLRGGWEYVASFEYTSPNFMIQAPIPGDPMYAGMMCSFRYFAFAPNGGFAGISPVAKKPVPPIEME